MRLTPFAKLFITVVILAVVGYGVYYYRGDAVRKWAVGDKPASGKSEQVNSTDFDPLRTAPADPARNFGATGVTGAALATGGRLNRPLVVAINTWAGHSPGIVFNGGLDPNAAVGKFSLLKGQHFAQRIHEIQLSQIGRLRTDGLEEIRDDAIQARNFLATDANRVLE